MFCDFDIETIKEIPKIHTKWNIREEEYSTSILTKDLEIHIINLSKLGTSEWTRDKKLEAWLNFLTKPEEMGVEEMEEVEEIKLAKEELEKIKMDAREKRLAELREKHIRDTMAVHDLRI